MDEVLELLDNVTSNADERVSEIFTDITQNYVPSFFAISRTGTKTEKECAGT